MYLTLIYFRETSAFAISRRNTKNDILEILKYLNIFKPVKQCSNNFRSTKATHAILFQTLPNQIPFYLLNYL